jgi:arginase family enzyme
MIADFLQPVDFKLIAELSRLNKNCIGNHLTIHANDEFPLLDNVDVAFIGILDQRGSGSEEELNLEQLRLALYKLFQGDWDLKMIDLGDIRKGASQNDTYYAVQQLTYTLQEYGIKGVFLSGSQDMTFPIYSAYQLRKKLINLVNIDYRFDLDSYEDIVSANTFVSKMIMQEPVVLNDYTVLGHQSYFVSQESLDLMQAMYFEAIRLGDISHQMISTEPKLRYAEVVSIDMNAVESSYSANFKTFTPNGFTGKEICALSRYAGLGINQAYLGLFNHHATTNESQLIAQIIWYYLDGLSQRIIEYPLENINNFIKYIVPIDDDEFVFYKSKRTERWWIEIKKINEPYNKENIMSLLACAEADYLCACNQEIPNIWLKNQRKYMN